MTLKNFASAIALTAALAIAGQAAAQSAPGAPAPEAPRPNVFVWMLDDVGFAQLSSFGGLVDTPNIDRVAAMGLRYSNYHTAPICSASRAAFLTGRNPHSVHMGGHAITAVSMPGYDALLPAEDGTIAENLRQAGYHTYAIGKWDHLPVAEQSSGGPFTRWPLGQGFERFYGFLAAETDNWTPVLYQDNSPIAAPVTPDYHLSEDLAGRAIEMISTRNVDRSPAPFFMYWATGVAHAPHHAPADWIERYRGRFDLGWDAARAEILRRQIEQGLVPEGAELAPRPEGMPAWDTLSADQRRLYARQMEVFAAAISHADHEFGRILDALEAAGELDNTIIIITSDNGASGEGAFAGTFHEHTFVNEQVATDEDNMPFLDRWGGPATYPHYSFGWAVAGNTPYRYYKQTTHEGGTRVPLIIAWADGIAARGEIRDQFAYVTDITPTLLDVLDAPLAETVNDVDQAPLEGRSLVASFTDPEARDTIRNQYVEIFGSKGLWSDDGWAIVTTHRIHTWGSTVVAPVNAPWQLYNLNVDPGQTNDVAAEYPERVASMAAEFERQAELYNVNPIEDIRTSRALMGQRLQNDFIRHGGIWRFPEPVTRIAPLAAPPITNIGFRMSADVALETGRETGPIFASGGELGGVGFYLRSGRPVLAIRSLEGELITVESRSALPRGTTRLELEFVRPPTASMTPLDIQVTIRANGSTLVQRTINAELPISISETFDIGRDDGRTIVDVYQPNVPFPGELRNIVFDFSDILRNPPQQ
jgi:arylsulfatase